MMTSYYGNLKKIPEGLEPVSVSRGAPKTFQGRKVLALAPTWKMLKMGRTEYDALYEAILSNLDPHEIARELGPNAVLLCWEKPGEWCHRRRAAEWLEQALKIEIPEVGFARSDCPAYADLK